MLRQSFPDLKWLQKRAEGKVFSPQGPDSQLKKVGWPNCIMNAQAKAAYRPHIRGPLSLFMNLRGFSHCEVENRRVLIDSQSYYLSNQNQYYTLEIENPEPTETFNIHFGESFLEQFFYGLSTSDVQLLSEPMPSNKDRYPLFINQTYPKTPEFQRLLHVLLFEMKSAPDPLKEEELLADILYFLLRQHHDIEKTIYKLPAVKSATRRELYQRLAFAKDFIHTHYAETLSLDKLAGIACLSKYHFLRVFKVQFGLTPYQYLLKVRLEKAKSLLKRTPLSLTQIALDTGFEHPSSLSRQFKQKFTCHPLTYREDQK